MRLKILTAFFCIAMIVAAAAGQDKVGRMLKLAHEKGEFSGVVVATINGKVIYQGAVGLANRQFNLLNAGTTKFRICSITKQFTALLIMQLVEAGKIGLDRSVSEYLPEFRKDTAAKVTVRDLLLSASGIPDLPDEFYVSEDAKSADAAFVIGKYLQGDLAFVPGERFNYNNGDFIILGAIVSKVYGKPFETVLKEKILGPLGMKETALLRNEDVVPGLAYGYSYKDGRYSNESFVQIQNFGAAGAMYSTAADMLKWDAALISNKLLSKKWTDEMFTPSAKLGFVGLGSWIYKIKFPSGKMSRIVERQGYINGFCALNIIIPEENVSLVFLGNTETQTLFQTYASKGLSFDVLNELVGK